MAALVRLRALMAAAVGLACHAPALASSVVTSPYVVQRQWQTGPLVSGGLARCKLAGGCHGFGYNPNAQTNGNIANQGDVMVYAWNGVSAGTSGVDMRTIGAFWPQGQFKVPGEGVEGYADEWEGVQ